MTTVLKFYAPWCKPCAILSGRLEEYEDIITTVNIENNKELAQKYHVRTVPTLIFLENNEEVHRSTGLITVSEFQSILNSIEKKELSSDALTNELIIKLKQKKE